MCDKNTGQAVVFFQKSISVGVSGAGAERTRGEEPALGRPWPEQAQPPCLGVTRLRLRPQRPAAPLASARRVGWPVSVPALDPLSCWSRFYPVVYICSLASWKLRFIIKIDWLQCRENDHKETLLQFFIIAIIYF